MYRLDKRVHRHKRARHIVVAVVTLGAFLGGYYTLIHLRIAPKQELHNSAPMSRQYNATAQKKITVDKPQFTMQVPQDWKEVSTDPELMVTPLPDYTFHSSSKPGQSLSIYIDEIPDTLAVNKAIVVSAEGNGLSYGLVSENCTTFTDPNKEDQRTKTIRARWQSIDFICDSGNFNRQVVGTESTEGINQVTLSGAQSGKRKLFIRYVDNHVSPDYSVLYNILSSLTFK